MLFAWEERGIASHWCGSDGLDAVHKAAELRPDFILLDIGLPTINGLEAARRIRELVPESKILFLSQDSDPDIVQEALSIGAVGYLAKAFAGDLLTAVDAIIQGRQFVRLPDRISNSQFDRQVPDRPRSVDVPGTPLPGETD
jgi:DNA-binding NarL/FixJ family response regulator